MTLYFVIEYFQNLRPSRLVGQIITPSFCLFVKKRSNYNANIYNNVRSHPLLNKIKKQMITRYFIILNKLIINESLNRNEIELHNFFYNKNKKDQILISKMTLDRFILLLKSIIIKVI
jgi:hypothetical protein